MRELARRAPAPGRQSPASRQPVGVCRSPCTPALRSTNTPHLLGVGNEQNETRTFNTGLSHFFFRSLAFLRLLIQVFCKKYT